MNGTKKSTWKLISFNTHGELSQSEENKLCDIKSKKGVIPIWLMSRDYKGASKWLKKLWSLRNFFKPFDNPQQSPDMSQVGVTPFSLI